MAHKQQGDGKGDASSTSSSGHENLRRPKSPTKEIGMKVEKPSNDQQAPPVQGSRINWSKSRYKDSFPSFPGFPLRLGGYPLPRPSSAAIHRPPCCLCIALPYETGEGKEQTWMDYEDEEQMFQFEMAVMGHPTTFTRRPSLKDEEEDEENSKDGMGVSWMDYEDEEQMFAFENMLKGPNRLATLKRGTSLLGLGRVDSVEDIVANEEREGRLERYIKGLDYEIEEELEKAKKAKKTRKQSTNRGHLRRNSAPDISQNVSKIKVPAPSSPPPELSWVDYEDESQMMEFESVLKHELGKVGPTSPILSPRSRKEKKRERKKRKEKEKEKEREREKEKEEGEENTESTKRKKEVTSNLKRLAPPKASVSKLSPPGTVSPPADDEKEQKSDKKESRRNKLSGRKEKEPSWVDYNDESQMVEFESRLKGT